MHMGSYKNLPFFQVSDTGWFHTFTEFQNHSDIGWDDVWSRWCFPLHIHLDHMHPKSRSQDYTMTSGSAFGYKIQTVQEPELTAKMLRKCSFQGRWLKDSAYQDLGLKDKLDRHCSIHGLQNSANFLCSLLLRWSLQNLILVLTSPYNL